MSARRRRELESLPHRLWTVWRRSSAPENEAHRIAGIWLGVAVRPASLVLCVEAALSLRLLVVVVVNCRLPSARGTGTPDGRSCGGLSSESKVAGDVEDGDVEDGDEDGKAHWPLGRFVTKSDTLSRLSLIQAVWRVGRILGEEFGSGTRHGYIQAWRRINGAPELRARKQGFAKSSRTTRKTVCRDG